MKNPEHKNKQDISWHCMPDLLNVTFPQGVEAPPNPLGMREMQARVWEKRSAQYLLLKAPPASGKSRALMYIALDKIRNQGLEKAIIAVPEMSIGGSFANVRLSESGFFEDWRIEEKYNLCLPGNAGKVDRFLAFLEDVGARLLLCTHATLRFAFDRLEDISTLDNCLVAIDEFHHVSEEDGNRLGSIIDELIAKTSAHILAMTGSYFRGDQVPILNPGAEARFVQVSYTYYEQLKSYKYLKSLDIGYHFYQGRYISALESVLDLSKKTIIHIPAVNSRESSGLKLAEVDSILDLIGSVRSIDRHGILHLRSRSGKMLKVADLVTDNPGRAKVLAYLRGIEKRDDLDMIIALGMAKEGFDWPWCEHVLTIGYRNSMTEVVQIIGRATRDCEGKSHARFTNLIARPDAEDDDVRVAVNNLLKAITLSLLMREVLAPNITFRPRSSMADGEIAGPDEIVILDTQKPLSPRVKKILEEGGIERVVSELVSSPAIVGPAIVDPTRARLAMEVDLPGIIMRTWDDLPPEDVGAIRDMAKTRLVVQAGGGLREEAASYGNAAPNRRIVNVGDKFINVDDLTMDLIDSINPFQGAYEILSRAIDAPMLRTIQDCLICERSEMTSAEAVMLWPEILKFYQENGRPPDSHGLDAFEARLGQALAYIRTQKARKMSGP